MKPFKTQERICSALAVMGAIEDEGPRVCSTLDPRHSPAGGAGPGPFRTCLLQILTVLGHAREKLAAAVERHARRLAAAAESRRHRDRLAAELGDLILGMRTSCVGLYVVDDPEALGFPKKIGREPPELLEQSDCLEEHFSGDGFEMPEPRFEKLELEPADLVQHVVAKAGELRGAVGDVERQSELARDSHRELGREVAAFDGVFLWAARGAESVFTLAGEDELAARVKPSTARPGCTEAPPPEVAADLSADG